jgi:hypothetical protein
MSPRRVNADHEELIGQHFRLPGSILTNVVEDVHAETQGVVIAVNCISFKPFEVDAWAVRNAIAARAAR